MDKFNPRHLIFIILGVSIVSLKTYPRVFLENGQRDSWIAVIISSMMIFFFYIYIISIWKRSDEKNFVKIYKLALGNILGNIFLALFVMNLFLTLIECSAVEADSMHQVMLIETPKWFFLLLFIIPCIYVVNKNIAAIVSISIIGIVLIMIAGINLGIMTIGYKKISMLFPIFENGVTGNFILSILETLGLYGSISISLPYLSKIQDKRNKITRDSIIALIILIQMEIISTSGILMTFDLERALSMNYPKLLQTQLISYFQFLDFGELYVMLQIVGGWLLKYIITLFGILSILREFKLGNRLVAIICYIISGVVYLLAYYASKDSFILFDLLDIYQYISLFNYVLVPFAVFSILGAKNAKSKARV